jgi:hypothetical protein
MSSRKPALLSGLATSPADIVDRYPTFFWESVSVQIAPAVRHLEVTAEGRRWLAQLHANVFRAEHRQDLSDHVE